MSGPTRLRALLEERRPVLAAGAHDGLSAILARDAGFDCLWSSGFAISAAHGVPDANILTMSDQLRVAAEMVERAGIPVIADCDNGFGNAINVIHTARAFEREGVAAICIEDNVFPKRCSFYVGVARELADPEEHAGKIQACLDTRRDDRFAVIARTEALVAGWGMEEALRRGRRYADAGADLVLIHSKAAGPEEVLEFARRWDRVVPLVCVPTTYAATPVDLLADAGFRLVIFANQGLRASIQGMQRAYARLAAERRADAADDLAVPLEHVHDLMGVSKMREDERSYLPAASARVRAVVLAAGQSPDLAELTADRPKAMLDIKGKTLLERQVEALNTAGIRDISVVVGWRKEAVDLPNLRRYEVDERAGNELSSLMQAQAELGERSLVLYGDILFDPDLVVRLLQTEGDVVLVVDRADSDRKGRDLVLTENDVDGRGRVLRGRRTDAVRSIGRDLDRANGEWIGILMLSEAGAAAIRRVHAEAAAAAAAPFGEAPSLREAKLTDLVHALIDDGVEVRCIDTYQGWMEVNTFEDYRRAWAQVK
jgi:phosphoenolpyruvate phosphomutase